MALIEFTPKGFYCPRADIFIDPWRKVEKALITHGHSDHAYAGHGSYLCTKSCAPVIRHRLGKINIQSVNYAEPVNINGVTFSFHPAGHVIGSAQIRVEYKGEVWVASGDYKTVDDGITEPFEPVRCHTFITESTFGMPLYQWSPQRVVFQAMNDWWRENRELGITSVLSAYSLGKAQRILANIDTSAGRIFCHSAVHQMNKVLIASGLPLPETELLHPGLTAKDLNGSLLIGPSSSIGLELSDKLERVEIAAASGWMQLRKARKQRSVEHSFVLSDHADWNGLNNAVKATGAERVFVTHGFTETYTRWLCAQGYDAQIVKTTYGGEEA